MDRRKNLVFIVVDQWRKQAAGYWSKPPYRAALHDRGDPAITPNIDRLADESVVLSQAISTFPLCSPFRGMMLSGKLPHRNGLVMNCHSGRPTSQLREDVTCVGDVMKANGYSMGYIGKLHTDFPEPNLPGGKYATEPLEDGHVWDAYTKPGRRRHGFDYWYSYGTFDQHFNPHYWDTEGNYHEPGQWSADHEAYKAISYIRNTDQQRVQGKPFGLWVSMNPPHNPYNESKKMDRKLYDGKTWEDLAVRLNIDPENETMRTQLKSYLAMVTGVDRAVGRILGAIEEHGLKDDTVVVLTSDHGEAMGSHGLLAKNHPYAESLDVPFMVRSPGELKPRVDDLLLGSCDIMPTLLGLVGLEASIPDDLDGGNRVQALHGDKGGRPKAGIFFRHVNAPADPDGKVRDFVVNLLGVKTHKHTLWITAAESEEDGLFDMVNDPYQLNNLFDEHERLRNKLLAALEEAIPKNFPMDKLHEDVARKLAGALEPC